MGLPAADALYSHNICTAQLRALKERKKQGRAVYLGIKPVAKQKSAEPVKPKPQEAQSIEEMQAALEQLLNPDPEFRRLYYDENNRLRQNFQRKKEELEAALVGYREAVSV
jgi:hypothetical protein